MPGYRQLCSCQLVAVIDCPSCEVPLTVKQADAITIIREETVLGAGRRRSARLCLKRETVASSKMADDEQFSLCWNNFNSNLSAGFHESLQRGDLVDVTLAAEGQLVQAHRLVLSVCSPYFRKMFNQMPKNQHAFVFLKDVTHAALQDLIQFMYCGEVNVKQDALPAFISTAEALQIKGLTETGDSAPPQQSPTKEEASVVPATTASIATTVPVASQRAKGQRNRVQSYKIESEESGDDKIVHIQASTSHHVAAQQLQAQTNVSSQKRTLVQRSSSSHVTKRPKISISASSDGMDTSDNIPSQTQTVQTVQIVKQIPAQVIEPEYIELPMESINPKAEPEYTDETAEIETVDAETEQEHKLSEHDQGDADDEGHYVEDETYGDMAMGKYEESYLTEGEDGAKPGASGFVDSYTSDGGTGTEQSAQDQGSLRSTGADACNSGTQADILKTIKKEEDSIEADELLDNSQLPPLSSFSANETSTTAKMNWSEGKATPKSYTIIATRNSTRLAGRKDATVLSQEKCLLEDGSTVNKFHELKKSNGSPAHRSRCVTCFNRNILESERMPKPKTKWVTTFCGHSSSSARHHHTHGLDVARTTYVLPQNGNMRPIANVNRNYLAPSTTVVSSNESSKSLLGPTATVSSVSHRSKVSSTDVEQASIIVKFIRSQKKCAQLVYDGYIYNRKTFHQNGRTTWRCTELLKYHCKASCVTKLNRLISTRSEHNHADHTLKISDKTLYDYPEDLEEYMNIHTRDPIDIEKHKLDVIDTGAEYKVVIRGHNTEADDNYLFGLDIKRPTTANGKHLFLSSRKGGLQLVHDNFLYRSNLRRQGRNGDVIYWECIYNRGQKCRGRLKTIGNSIYVTNGEGTRKWNSSSTHSRLSLRKPFTHERDHDTAKKMLFVRSSWGRKHLIYDGYTYATNKRIEATNTTYWRCTLFHRRNVKIPCEARCTVRDGKIVKMFDSHNHPPEVTKLNGKELETEYCIRDP
uniref:BTB domain-containing protein n=1 Tax=Anopheles culicifacies TaxID=139723 RepID=A0A182MC08_9DIPT